MAEGSSRHPRSAAQMCTHLHSSTIQRAQARIRRRRLASRRRAQSGPNSAHRRALNAQPRGSSEKRALRDRARASIRASRASAVRFGGFEARSGRSIARASSVRPLRARSRARRQYRSPLRFVAASPTLKLVERMIDTTARSIARLQNLLATGIAAGPSKQAPDCHPARAAPGRNAPANRDPVRAPKRPGARRAASR